MRSVGMTVGGKRRQRQNRPILLIGPPVRGWRRANPTRRAKRAPTRTQV